MSVAIGVTSAQTCPTLAPQVVGVNGIPGVKWVAVMLVDVHERCFEEREERRRSHREGEQTSSERYFGRPIVEDAFHVPNQGAPWPGGPLAPSSTLLTRLMGSCILHASYGVKLHRQLHRQLHRRRGRRVPMTSPSLIELTPGIAQRTILADCAYHTLKHQILTCRLQPGQRVLERDLSAEMRVSRTPIREALNRLSLEGLIQATPHRGFKVTPVTVGAFRRLCEVRRVVETAAAALAADRATPDDVDHLKTCAHLSYVPGNRDSYEAYLRANCTFHLRLARCTRNPDLEGIVIGVIDKLQRPLYLGLNVGIDAASSSAEHFRIVDAVEHHDHDRARQLMLEHTEAAEERIASALEVAGY